TDMHPEFAPISFIAVFSLLPVLPWHWHARNVATLSIIAWLFIINLICAVDAIIWAGSVDIVVPVWCDISVKLIFGSNFALPAACLCICIHLEQISSRTPEITSTDDRSRQIFEGSMCLGLPILFMALGCVVRDHRFDIIEDYGCRPSTYFSIPAVFIIWVPQLVLTAATLVFAGLALRHFIRHCTFAAHLGANHSSLTNSGYLRLMIMSASQMAWFIALNIFALWFTTVSNPIRPWTSWMDVHSNFSRVGQFPALSSPHMYRSARYAMWWAVPTATFVFVACFAFSEESMVEYTKAFYWIRSIILRLPV
ncbi:GPCR fungal pheromone mating factor, partial [Mycena galopus ATCC 62051]